MCIEKDLEENQWSKKFLELSLIVYLLVPQKVRWRAVELENNQVQIIIAI
jgi:hypothetical protein